MLTCPVCGRSDVSRPVFQVWDEGRSFVTRTSDAREWTEEVLSPLAARVAPPPAPARRWLLWAAGISVVSTLVGVHPFVLWGFVAAPVFLVLYAAGRVRNEGRSERAHELWRQTWYCHGCDHVWLPGSRRRPVPARRLRQMIWRSPWSNS